MFIFSNYTSYRDNETQLILKKYLSNHNALVEALTEKKTKRKKPLKICNFFNTKSFNSFTWIMNDLHNKKLEKQIKYFY